MNTPAVRTGADVLAAEGFRRLRGQRVGLVCNHTAVVGPGLLHLADALSAADDVALAALFGPEHGVWGEAQDMEAVAGRGRDAHTGVPLHSLYGSEVTSLKPRPEELEGLDVLVFDIQDVGSRYYTFQATLRLCMEAAGEAGIPVMVLDRPNPLGGETVEGGTVEPGFESFVGIEPMPVRHGMTVGELARYYRHGRGVVCDLEVVAMEGWRRSQWYEDTGLAWIPPSPNMPLVETAVVYPGMCLVEGTELSEGRGTTRPFEQAGAPWVDPWALAERLDALDHHLDFGGPLLRPSYFRPTFHKHGGEACGGVFIHVRDRAAFRPYRFGLAWLSALRDLWPRRFAWRARAYEFVEDVPAIDLLTGSSAVREALDAGSDLEPVIRAQDEAAAQFAAARTPYLMYE